VKALGGLAVHRTEVLHVAARLGRPRRAVGGRASEPVVDVVDRRVGAVLGAQLQAVVLAQQDGNVAVRVVEVAEGESTRLTGVDAGRRGVAVDAGPQPSGRAVVDALGAEVALLGGPHLVRVELLALLLERGLLVAGEVAGVLVFGEEGAVLVRAGDDTVAAADTLVRVDGDDAVFALMRGLGGAGVRAGCVSALVAAHRVRAHVDAAAFVHFVGYELHPGHVERQEVLDPARRDAGMAPHALRQVDDHSPSHVWLSCGRSTRGLDA
jgi:hypothetical protein